MISIWFSIGGRDREGQISVGKIEEFREWMDRLELVDIPLMGGNSTWSNSRDNPVMSRIDRFLISNMLLMQLVGLGQKVLNRPISDHFPICIDSNGIIWGPGPFRLDNKWLRVMGFKQLVEKEWGVGCEFCQRHGQFCFCFKIKGTKK